MRKRPFTLFFLLLVFIIVSAVGVIAIDRFMFLKIPIDGETLLALNQKQISSLSFRKYYPGFSSILSPEEYDLYFNASFENGNHMKNVILGFNVRDQNSLEIVVIEECDFLYHEMLRIEEKLILLSKEDHEKLLTQKYNFVIPLRSYVKALLFRPREIVSVVSPFKISLVLKKKHRVEFHQIKSRTMYKISQSVAP
jgi:hypothetical protein